MFLLNRANHRKLDSVRLGGWSVSLHNGSSPCITDRTSLLNVQLDFTMNVKPRHLAALQYGVLAMFLLAIWFAMLTPLEQASEQLRHIFVDEAVKVFSFSLATATVGAAILMALFCLNQSESKGMSTMLASVSTTFFGLAVWQFSQALIVGFGVASILAIWSWRSSNSPLHNDAQARQ